MLYYLLPLPPPLFPLLPCRVLYLCQIDLYELILNQGNQSFYICIANIFSPVISCLSVFVKNIVAVRNIKLFFFLRNERRVEIQKSWPYFVLCVSPSSCGLGECVFLALETPCHLTHRDRSEGVMGTGVLPTSKFAQVLTNLLGFLRAGELMNSHNYKCQIWPLDEIIPGGQTPWVILTSVSQHPAQFLK